MRVARSQTSRSSLLLLGLMSVAMLTLHGCSYRVEYVRAPDFYRQAIQLLQEGRFEPAVTALDSFLRTEPRHPGERYEN